MMLFGGAFASLVHMRFWHRKNNKRTKRVEQNYNEYSPRLIEKLTEDSRAFVGDSVAFGLWPGAPHYTVLLSYTLLSRSFWDRHRYLQRLICVAWDYNQHTPWVQAAVSARNQKRLYITYWRAARELTVHFGTKLKSSVSGNELHSPFNQGRRRHSHKARRGDAGSAVGWTRHNVKNSKGDNEYWRDWLRNLLKIQKRSSEIRESCCTFCDVTGWAAV